MARPSSSTSLSLSDSPINYQLNPWSTMPFLVDLWQTMERSSFVICLSTRSFVHCHPADCYMASTRRASQVLFAVKTLVFSLAEPLWLQQSWFSFQCGIFRNYVSRYLFSYRGLCGFAVSSVYFGHSAKRTRGETGSLLHNQPHKDTCLDSEAEVDLAPWRSPV